MLLSDQQIKEAIASKEIEINPYEEDQIEPATYDMRIGKFGVTSSSKKKTNIEEHGYILLEPGDFGVIEIYEQLRLGNQFAARFGLRSKYARKGLIATTGTQIDPGYNGRLIIGVMNLTPKKISLPYKDDLVSVEFHKLEKPSLKPYAGPYQNKMGIGPDEMEFITENDGMAFSEIITTLRSLNSSVGTMTDDVTKLTHAVTNFRTIMYILFSVVALLAAILALIQRN